MSTYRLVFLKTKINSWKKSFTEYDHRGINGNVNELDEKADESRLSA